ncbi:MAG: tetratricopeptide repeat protein [Candidatus Aminicenantes bacterium]|jgi:Tfp pilus assembly protein PilF
MHKKKSAFIFTIFLFIIILSACRTAVQQDQIQFGILAAQNSLWDEAIFRWKKAIQKNPASAAAHNNLAVAYENRGLWEKAREEYQAALNLAPKNNYIQSNFENFKKSLEARENIQQEKKDEKK